MSVSTKVGVDLTISFKLRQVPCLRTASLCLPPACGGRKIPKAIRVGNPRRMRGAEGSSIDPSNGRFFHDIEALRKALDAGPKPLRSRGRGLPPPGSRAVSSSMSLAQLDPNRKEKKPSSLWNWKPLKALSHIRHRRFECVFSLRVHSIENLPPALSDASLCVHWRRSTAGSSSAHTRPAGVFRGAAKFEETLTHHCSVYGSRSRVQGSAKYEARHFLVYATVAGAPGLDLGKHRVDLTRLLPLNLEELEGEKSSGKWNTSFRLSGKACGSTLNVSFGFLVAVGDDKVQNSSVDESISDTLGRERDKLSKINHVGSLPGIKFQFSGDVKAIGEVSESLFKISETSHELIPGSVVSRAEIGVIDEQSNSAQIKCCVKEAEGPEFMVVEHGIEIAAEDSINEPAIKRLYSAGAIAPDSSEIEVIAWETNQKQDENAYHDQCTIEPTVKDLVSAFHDLSIHELDEPEYPEPKAKALEKPSFGGVELMHKVESMMSSSHNLDDLTDEVASEFLSMLAVEHNVSGLSSESDPESPREQLWKQFKSDSLVSNGGMLCLDIEADEQLCWGSSSELFDFSSVVYDDDLENQKPSQAMDSKSVAQILEDAETEALLREWGLDENVFDCSSPVSRIGFGSPIHLPPEDPAELPPLGENLGPFVQTKTGGFLRSMSPKLFKDSKNKGNLIMQISKPVVMPAEMGSDAIEILQHLASIGVEKLSMQASKLMPLEEITGSSMQELAWEAAPDLEAYQRNDSLLHLYNEHKSGFDLNTSGREGKHIRTAPSRGDELNCDYVSLEDLAPLAMDKIEALSIEGLKVQSGLSNDEAPLNIIKQFVGDMPAVEGKEAYSLTSLDLEGAVGLQLPDAKGNGHDIDGLMGLSITLDEWMQLDMGIVEEENELSDRTSKILAAHHAKSTEFSNRGGKDDKRGKMPGRRRGLLENNFTVALMVQLRDPLRNYEPVGTPMLALIQVERVFAPPKPKIYSSVSEKGNSEQENQSDSELDPGLKPQKEKVENVISQFKVTEVHVAGLKTDPEKTRHWGSSIQQQSGSRWLLANGMGKQNKHPFMMSNTSKKLSSPTTKEETLWSISSRTHGNGSNWKEVAASKPHIRIPNFLFFR